MLKLRSKKSLIETLLHETIHALHFITQVCDGYDGHSPAFHREARRINRLVKLNITVSHKDHVKQITVFWNYKTIDKQIPQSADAWCSEHQRTCGGKFIKIAEPDKKQTKVKRGPLDGCYKEAKSRKVCNKFYQN
ncbi:hypothetical protein BCV72DRAFT_304999 [Rhizopus microsporus var. microsporus]|uniref:SprT-like domain-containing protein n=2 Tax=Rhizopus microsporus TaxID=58291 RepID=A0A2G4T4U4_RHIZD|nr:uncharacterized protein RHIMIDRAFT_233640 [Rhizopus microsporus ATCC 52813]ORE07062.1 hypothetical protein BCV72DRAFT_304999 [Rhizopus microsporus var. microsporus]PHZ16037.1 hypothetical protein RHIMIDRAFT_233640 [Rhizopus microsporus ATCC 52813]